VKDRPELQTGGALGFSKGSRAAARMAKPEPFEGVLISQRGAKVRCAKGVVVDAQKSWTGHATQIQEPGHA